MKHRIGFNPLDRKPSHRKALHRNMVTSLFKHERIRTTKAKAKAIRRTAEKMITRAKVDSVHNRRMIFRDLKDKAILAKLFVELGPRFKERPGGYTRMLKIGPRPGDAADMVILELVGEMGEKSESKPKSADAKKSSAPAKAAKSKSEKAKAEPKAEPKSDAPAVAEESEPTAESVEDEAESVSDEPVAEETGEETVAAEDTATDESPSDEEK